MDFEKIIKENIDIINILDWLKNKVRISLFYGQFMRNIQNFISYFILINEYQENLKKLNALKIKYDKIEELKYYEMINITYNKWQISKIWLTWIWKEFLEKLNQSLINKLIKPELFKKEIIENFNSSKKAPSNILKIYYWSAHPDELVYLLLKTLKDNNTNSYQKLKTNVFNLIKNTNIRINDKLSDDEFSIIFLNKILYWTTEDNSLFRILKKTKKDEFKKYLLNIYNSYLIIKKEFEENGDFLHFLKKEHKEVYKILKVSEYQEEIYLQSFIDIKALIFLEYNNI